MAVIALGKDQRPCAMFLLLLLLNGLTVEAIIKCSLPVGLRRMTLRVNAPRVNFLAPRTQVKRIPYAFLTFVSS